VEDLARKEGSAVFPGTDTGAGNKEGVFLYAVPIGLTDDNEVHRVCVYKFKSMNKMMAQYLNNATISKKSRRYSATEYGPGAVT